MKELKITKDITEMWVKKFGNINHVKYCVSGNSKTNQVDLTFNFDYSMLLEDTVEEFLSDLDDYLFTNIKSNQFQLLKDETELIIEL